MDPIIELLSDSEATSALAQDNNKVIEHTDPSLMFESSGSTAPSGFNIKVKYLPTGPHSSFALVPSDVDSQQQDTAQGQLIW